MGNNSLIAVDSEDIDGDVNTTEFIPFDQRGLSRISGGTVDIGAFEFQVNNNPTNQAPTNLTLSNNNIAENQSIGTVIGNLSTTDPDTGNTFTYSLVIGTGSTDNTLFTLQNNQLKSKAIFDYETKNSYSIRFKTTDQGGLSFEKVFTISITDINEIIGDNTNNNLVGTVGNDYIDGKGGNDILNGGIGSDTLIGSKGNDTHIVDSTGDVITENLNEGTDTVRTSINYTLGANLEKLTLTGESAINGTGNSLNNTLTGNSGNNTLNGDAGNDTLNGGTGNDSLSGSLDNDSLIGGAGKDTLVGGTGNDTLTGGKSSDLFTFNSPTEGIDRLTDFNVINDTIAVSAAGFGSGLVSGAAISAAQFVIASAATTANQRLIYNATLGELFFDPDGTGTTAQIQLATLNTGLALTNADILVVV